MLYLLRQRSVRVLLDGMHVQQRRTGVCVTGDAHFAAPCIAPGCQQGISDRNG